MEYSGEILTALLKSNSSISVLEWVELFNGSRLAIYTTIDQHEKENILKIVPILSVFDVDMKRNGEMIKNNLYNS